jgi:hypothetical protein
VQTVDVRIEANLGLGARITRIADDILSAASGSSRLHACKGEGRLHAGNCTETGEAESDDESFAHFQFSFRVECRLLKWLAMG